MYRILVSLEGAGDHVFVTEEVYPDSGPANAHEFMDYLRGNYPGIHFELVPVPDPKKS